MPTFKVTFQPAGRTVEVEPADFPCGRIGEPGSLLDIAVGNGLPIEHACGGAGACGTCHVLVESGMENLSPPDDDELDTLEAAPGNTARSRLACQAVVGGDVTVTVPDRNRNAVKEGR